MPPTSLGRTPEGVAGGGDWKRVALEGGEWGTGTDGINRVSARLGGEGETSLVRAEEGDRREAGAVARGGLGCLGARGIS